MENRINIAELLKDCPKGMELDCTMFDNVSFLRIQNGTNQIIICTPDGRLKFLNSYGCYHDENSAKCVIFPKGKTTWEGIKAPFKDGDIVSTDDGIFTAIVCKVVECETKDLYNHNEVYDTYCHIYYEEDDDKAYFMADATPLRFCRLANEEEKERLFQAIKDDGYKWNAETKTLEKLIEPRFKVGDKIRQKNHHEVCLISEMRDNHYLLDEKDIALPFFAQDQWELVPNKFDIANMKPFESRVLVRDDNGGIWRVSFWGCLLEDCEDFKYDTTRGSFAQCIPYEGNEHLLGTDEDCDEYYKTWK